MNTNSLQEVDQEVSDIMRRHRISNDLGFLGENPLTHLPYNYWDEARNEYFKTIDRMAYALPESIENQTVAENIANIQIPSWLQLENLSWAAQNRFMFATGLLIHSLFRETLHYPDVSALRKDESIKYLLPQLAIPMWEISKLTGFAPTLSYGLYSPWNYKLKNPDESISLANLELLHSFTDSMDEKWFVWIHQVVEKKFAPAIPALLKAILLTSVPTTKGAARVVTHVLADAAHAAEGVLMVLKRMREHCDPHTYFDTVRMFYSFPRNVVFLGVPEIAGQPKEFYGETGGQSPFMHFITGALGMYPTDSYFPLMRRHMSKYNRGLIELVLESSRLREYVLLHRLYKPLTRQYNRLVHAVLNWRIEHLSLAHDYIGKYGEGHGTGSTPLPWLHGLYDEAKKYLIE